MRLVQENALREFYGSNAGRSRFPHMVRSLIAASASLQKLRFPSDDATWLPGVDGAVICTEDTKYVPKGPSVWEVGTNDDPQSKANEDWNKRSYDKPGVATGLPDGLSRSDSAFIFVTPTIWQGKDAWITARQKEGIWKEVRAYDATDLKQWLEESSSVALAVAAEMGRAPSGGLFTPDQAWDDWSKRTQPPVSENLILAGRDQQKDEIARRLADAPSAFVVRGDSLQTAWGFALAAIRTIADQSARSAIQSRLIVADDEQVALGLQNVGNLVIVLKGTKGQVSGALPARGCHVIVPQGNDGGNEANVIRLARPSSGQFIEALEKMGLTREEAERHARISGLSVTILQRHGAVANAVKPKWVETDSAKLLIPILLLGRWDANNEADKAIVSKMAGIDPAKYAEVEKVLDPLLRVDEPPVQRTGNVWTLTSPTDAFVLTANLLEEVHVNLFKECFVEVFSRIDPRVDLPPDEWIYHDIKGNGAHSGWLRTGMAEALLLIANYGPHAQIRVLPQAQDYANDVVKALPNLNDSWKVLASIRDQYPKLIEAAPIPLLSSLERMLEARPSDVANLFVEGDHLFGGGSLHTGLLWGLEALAWSPDYLPRVAEILVKLDKLDPGIKMANRPLNSLGDIFSWWHPGTFASTEDKLAIIGAQLERDNEQGWRLLRKVVPKNHSGISIGTNKPIWRIFESNQPTQGSNFNYPISLIDLAIKNLGDAPDRWSEIIDAIKRYPIDVKKTAFEKLAGLADTITDPPKRQQFWEILRNFIARQRSFADAEWALDADSVDQLAQIAERFASKDILTKKRWLFEDAMPELPSGENDYDKQRAILETMRAEFVAEVVNAQGVEKLIEFAVAVKYPGLVADVFGRTHVADPATTFDWCLYALRLGEHGEFFASILSEKAFQKFGEAWTNLVLDSHRKGTISDSQAGTVTIFWGDTKNAWQIIDTFGKAVSDYYWKHKRVWAFQGTEEEILFEVDRLVAAGRAPEIIDRSLYLKKINLPSPLMLRIFDSAVAQINQMSEEQLRRFGMLTYHLNEFFKVLRSRDDIPRQEIATREFSVLPLLGYEASNLTLHHLVSEEPTLFVQLLCLVYIRSADVGKSRPETSEQDQMRGRAAFRLLEGMTVIPGAKDDDVDEAMLNKWVDEVRRLSIIEDRAAISDQKVGELLAHSPKDPTDGGWPHVAVRNLLERLQELEVGRGISVERFNMRGVYSKALYEGGKQERELSEQYRNWARICRIRWPWTANLLNSIADDWARHAQEEDIRAEQDKRRHI